ncbi:hypothetical protein MTBPR1_110060 [Candidatus Terasakiella magnetica]|uniref:Uncharacterized protein n=1 Tax=Candidatus Terasakiella magnetica TaxID=1867952 RepID=A0A1C3REF8_9PROT|nr:hypothetical protein MTBPR1_110060 [Candidatus Terasakiella magnetica]
MSRVSLNVKMKGCSYIPKTMWQAHDICQFHSLLKSLHQQKAVYHVLRTLMGQITRQKAGIEKPDEHWSIRFQK